MALFFLDESGDHLLHSLDPHYPVFVLAGVLFEEGYYTSVVEPEMAQLKRDLFGREDVVLHTADITRNRNGFEVLKNPSFRAKFYAELNQRMRKWHYQVIAVIVDKEKHRKRYGELALDPYDLSLEVVLERLVLEAQQRQEQVDVLVESRGSHLDARLKKTWESIRGKGTRYVSARKIDHYIKGLRFRAKGDNLAGLQVADLVASPIGRVYLGKGVKEDWHIIEEKFRKGPRGYEGYGLVVLPKD